MNGHYRANDEASFASEQLQRTFGFAMGSGAFFVPQVEVYENWEGSLIFSDAALTFFSCCGSSWLTICRLCRSLRDWHASLPDLPFERPRLLLWADGEADETLVDFPKGFGLRLWSSTTLRASVSGRRRGQFNSRRCFRKLFRAGLPQSGIDLPIRCQSFWVWQNSGHPRLRPAIHSGYKMFTLVGSRLFVKTSFSCHVFHGLSRI